MDKLTRLRKSRLLTVRRLAEKAGVSPNTVWRMEHGKGAHPGTISKVARALDVEPVELVKLD